MAAAPKPQAKLKDFSKRGFTFGMGGAMPPIPPGPPMAPPAGSIAPPQGMGDPASAMKQKMASVPPKDKGKIKKLIMGKLKSALKAQQAGGGAPPMAPPPGAGAPMPPPAMKRGGTVKKAIGGSVRGVGIARKGGGRGKIC